MLSYLNETIFKINVPDKCKYSKPMFIQEGLNGVPLKSVISKI